MADAPPLPDPFQMFKQAYDQAAEGWAQAVEQMISTEEFASAAGQFVDRYADMQEAMRRTAEAAVEYMHVPSKEDIARVAQLVINVERKADEVNDDLYELSKLVASLQTAVTGLAAAVAELPREGVSALDARLDRIETALAALAERPPVVAAPGPAAGAPAAAATAAAPTAEAPAPKAPARARRTATAKAAGDDAKPAATRRTGTTRAKKEA